MIPIGILRTKALTFSHNKNHNYSRGKRSSNRCKNMNFDFDIGYLKNVFVLSSMVCGPYLLLFPTISPRLLYIDDET